MISTFLRLIFAVTETWLHSDGTDNVTIGNLIPVGYLFQHIPRESRGGGVGFLFKKSLDAKTYSAECQTHFSSFEVTVMQIN